MSKLTLQAPRDGCWELPEIGAYEFRLMPAPVPRSMPARLAAAVGTAFGNWYMRRLERRAVRALQELDERTLRDIGIDRGGIHHAARHGRDVDRHWYLRHCE